MYEKIPTRFQYGSLSLSLYPPRVAGLKVCNQDSSSPACMGDKSAALTFTTRAAGGTSPVDTLSPPPLAPPAPPQQLPPPPCPAPSPRRPSSSSAPSLVQAPAPVPVPASSGRQPLGLFGSALVPAGNGTTPPRNWADNKKHELRRRSQQRQQQQQQRQRRQRQQQNSAMLAAGMTKQGGAVNAVGGGYDDGATRYRSRLDFAPVVLDWGTNTTSSSTTTSEAERHGRRVVRTAGLVGKALRVTRLNTMGKSQTTAGDSAVAKHKRSSKSLFGLSHGRESRLSGVQR